MSFSRTKPAGWTDDVDTITAAQINDIDVKTSQAVDGTAGGTYTNASALRFDGDFKLTNASQIKMSGTANVTLASRSITRHQETTPFGHGPSIDWYAVAVAPFRWLNQSAGTTPNTNTNPLVIPIHVPNGVTLNTVGVDVAAGLGHSGLPSVMPTLKVYKIATGDGTTTQLGSTATDSSASTGAFEAAHGIAVSSIATVVDRTTYKYVALLIPESSTNSRTGLAMYGCTVVYTTTSMDED